MLIRMAPTVATAQKTCKLACTDLLVNPDRPPKLGQSDLLYGSKLPAKKVDVNSLTAHVMLVVFMMLLYRLQINYVHFIITII